RCDHRLRIDRHIVSDRDRSGLNSLLVDSSRSGGNVRVIRNHDMRTYESVSTDRDGLHDMKHSSCRDEALIADDEVCFAVDDLQINTMFDLDAFADVETARKADLDIRADRSLCADATTADA